MHFQIRLQLKNTIPPPHAPKGGSAEPGTLDMLFNAVFYLKEFSLRNRPRTRSFIVKLD